MHTLQRLSFALAPALAGIGTVAVIGLNASRWRHDRAVAARRRLAHLAPPPPLEATPRVSVLVAAWNEREVIEAHLESVLRLRYPDLEYVLCAGGPDGTYAVAKRFERPGLTVLEQRPGEGKQGALRRCLAASSGEVIFLTDADCNLDDANLHRTLAPVINGEADASSGRVRPRDCDLRASPLCAYRWAVDRYTAAHAPDELTGLMGANAAVRRSALLAAGGMQESVSSGTDYHLAKALLREGYRIRHVPDSEITTRYPTRIDDYARRQRRWLRNVVLHGLRFGALDEATGVLKTSLLGLSMLLLPAAALLLGPTCLALWIVALLYSVSNKLRYIAFAAVLNRMVSARGLLRGALWTVPLTFVEFAIWSAPLLDYVDAQRRHTW